MRAGTQYILTANDLLEGDVIYLNENREWVRKLSQAYVFIDKADADAALNRAETNAALIGPYLTNINVEDGKPAPAHFREEFRAKGPSNYKHGKQEESHV